MTNDIAPRRKVAPNMDTRKIAIAAAGGTLGLVAMTPAIAWADSAPPGTASGSVLGASVGSQPVAAVSPTSASQSSSGSSSSGSVLDVGGSNVSPNEIDAGPAQVAPTSATSSGGTTESKAAVARANVGGDSGVTANVAQSDSKAGYTSNSDGSSSSRGDSSSDGATLNAGGSSGLNVDVLHSEAHSSGSSGSYLVGINGNNIGTSSDIGKICSSLSSSALQLACVTASGGNGSAVAEVLKALFPNSGPSLDVGVASAAGRAAPGAGLLPQVRGAAPGHASPNVAGLPFAPAGPGASTPANSSSLPFTGAPIEFLVFASLALLALGGVVVRVSTVVAPRLYG